MGCLIDGLFVSCHKYKHFDDAFWVDPAEIQQAVRLTKIALHEKLKIDSRKVYQGVLGLMLFQLVYHIVQFGWVISGAADLRRLMSRFCCSCVPKSMQNPVQEVSELIYGLFPKDSFIPSDVIAALSCMYATAVTESSDQLASKGNFNIALCL